MSDSYAPGQRPELQAVRAEIRRIMTDFGAAYWAEQDRDRQFPEQFFVTMGEAGYFGTLIPETYGGTDAGAAVASVIVEEINRAGGDAATVNAQMSICGALVRDGSPTLKERYLGGIADGHIRLLTVAATEPDSGADMGTLRSMAHREGDSWVVEAHKVFISLADYTRLIFLLVNTDQGPTLFLLDRDAYPEAITTYPMSMITNSSRS